jgi:hypothetical protein
MLIKNIKIKSLLSFLVVTLMVVALIPRGSVLAAAPGVINVYDFSLAPDGAVTTTNGNGSNDPAGWQQGSDIPIPGDEELHIVNGKLRHRGTDPFGLIATLLPGNASQPGRVTWGYAPSIVGPGGGFPGYSIPESDLSDVSVSLVNTGGLGSIFLAAIEESATSNTVLTMPKPDGSHPIPIIAGPVDLGRRLTAQDRLGFGWDGAGNYKGYLNGVEVISATDNSVPPSTYNATAITLHDETGRLPGMRWWALTTGADFNLDPVVDEKTPASSQGSTSKTGSNQLAETGQSAKLPTIALFILLIASTTCLCIISRKRYVYKR